MADPARFESPTPEQAFGLAVKRIGGQSAMARLIGRRQSTVWDWLKLEKPLPGEYVLKVEAATGVSRHDLRPDMYPHGLEDGRPFHGAVPLPGEMDLVAAEAGTVSQQDTRKEPAA